MRTVVHDNSVLYYYEEGELVGAIDYSEKSERYIEDAVNNWFDGIMTVETVERYSSWNYAEDNVNILFSVKNNEKTL